MHLNLQVIYLSSRTWWRGPTIKQWLINLHVYKVVKPVSNQTGMLMVSDGGSFKRLSSWLQWSLFSVVLSGDMRDFCVKDIAMVDGDLNRSHLQNQVICLFSVDCISIVSRC